MTPPASFSSDTFSPDKLIAGEIPPKSRKITLLAGENRTRGAVLGKITASGKYVLSAAAAGDGSEVPDVILAEDTDASAADVETIAYERADVNETALVLGAGHTLASIREGLRDKNITLVAVTAA